MTETGSTERESVWIVFTGEYENYGPFGPAFASRDDAETFAAAEDGEVTEFPVHAAAPVRLRHYRCEGWLPEIKDTIQRPNGKQGGFRIYEESWASWDVLVPEPLTVETDPWSNANDGAHQYAEAHGRDRTAVRRACVEALKALHSQSSDEGKAQ